MVRVVVDEPAVDKQFDYLVPDDLVPDGVVDATDGGMAVGTRLRVDLHGRPVGAWVTAVGVAPPDGVRLRPIRKVTGRGPAPEVVDLARWAAWRWAGRPVHFLRTASPPAAVRRLPPPPAGGTVPTGVADELADLALDRGRAVLRLPPAADRYPLLLAAAARGTTLVVAPSTAEATHLAVRLRRAGVATALVPGDWAAAAAGARVVIGARAAAWAPAVDLVAVVVLDEHEEVHQEEAAPTWNARDVAAERAIRAGAACVWTSSCPSLEALAWGELVAPSRRDERGGWPVVDVVDRRREEPRRADLYSAAVVDAVRSGRRVVCVLNRKGRARLLVCAACAEPARCESCGAAVAAGADSGVVCGRCGTVRPAVCLTCGAGTLKQRRLGVTRAREDLERLAGTPVAEVTGDQDPTDALPDAPVLVGTEAVLRRVEQADVVAFLDLDAELLAPRYRAAEEAMALVARAARVVGDRAGGGRILLQTRVPRHEVVQAALLADPTRVAGAEAPRREALRFPPAAAVALVSGAAGEQFAAAVRSAGHRDVEVAGPADGTWLVRAPDHRTLCDALAATPRPPGRLRVAVDPRRF